MLNFLQLITAAIHTILLGAGYLDLSGLVFLMTVADGKGLYRWLLLA